MRYFLSNTEHPIKYLSCGNMISQEEFVHIKRHFNINVLIMVNEGTLFISQGGINYEVRPKQYIFLNANEDHYGYKASSDRLSYLWVHFLLDNPTIIESNDHCLDNTLDNIVQNSDKFQFIIPEYGEISITKRAPLLFNQLLDLSRQDILYSKQITNYALSLLLMEISQEFLEMHFNTKKHILPNIARIMEWIKANYYKSITITQIANEFNYNPDYLSSLFHRSTGTSLVNYINKTKIDASKNLLANYDITIKEAAYSCGYFDEKYYMKVFKKLEGMTPSQYKKAFCQKMINH